MPIISEVFMTSIHFSPGKLSTPLPPQGLHFRILFMAKNPPLKIPYLSIARNAYSEQVGWNLQLGPNRGLRYFWYNFIIFKINNFMFYFLNLPHKNSKSLVNCFSSLDKFFLTKTT